MLKLLSIVIIGLCLSSEAAARGGGGGHGGGHASAHSSSVGRGSIYKGSTSSKTAPGAVFPVIPGHSAANQAEAAVEPENEHNVPEWLIVLLTIIFGLGSTGLAVAVGGLFGGDGSSGSWNDD